MNRRDALMLGATSLVVSAVVPASAQTKVDAQIAPKMKMTTDIPPSLTTPDKVETRIGTLNFIDGFPDKATADKVYDNLAFQRGVQAYLTALPAVSIEGARKGITGFGPVNQTVLIFEQLLDSKSLFLTAQSVISLPRGNSVAFGLMRTLGPDLSSALRTVFVPACGGAARSAPYKVFFGLLACSSKWVRPKDRGLEALIRFFIPSVPFSACPPWLKMDGPEPRGECWDLADVSLSRF